MTPCQILIKYQHDRASPEWMKDVKTRFDIEEKLVELEGKGHDPFKLIGELPGRHISGNHRWEIKEEYREELITKYGEDSEKYKMLYEEKRFWSDTWTQLFIGLSALQARYVYGSR